MTGVSVSRVIAFGLPKPGMIVVPAKAGMKEWSLVGSNDSECHRLRDAQDAPRPWLFGVGIPPPARAELMTRQCAGNPRVGVS